MGFGQSQSGQKTTYVNIVGGKLAVKAKEGDEGAVSRVNKNSITVWEMQYPNLTGAIVGVECKENEKLGAMEYVISIDDVGTPYKLSIPQDSKYGDSFADKLLNLKLRSVYSFIPYDFEDKESGKKRTGISICEGSPKGNKVASYYTKDDPKDKPQPKETMRTNDWKRYNIDLREFYQKVVDDFNAINAKPKSGNTNTQSATSQDDGSDLPFIITLLIGLSLVLPF